MSVGRSILPGCQALVFVDEIESVSATVHYTNDAHIKGWSPFGDLIDHTSHQTLDASYTWTVNDILACIGTLGDPISLPAGGLCFSRNCCGSFQVTTHGEESGTSVASISFGTDYHTGDVCLFAPGNTVTGNVGMDLVITPEPGPPITPAGVHGVFIMIQLVVLDNDFNDDGGFTCQYCGGIDRFTSSWKSPVFPYASWPIAPYKSIFDTFHFTITGHDDFSPPSANPPGGTDCGYDSVFDATVTVTPKT